MKVSKKHLNYIVAPMFKLKAKRETNQGSSAA